MIKEVLVCDDCGQGQEPSADPVHRFKINMGREMDPSGNGYNTIWDYKEFCTSCELDQRRKHGANLQPV